MNESAILDSLGLMVLCASGLLIVGERLRVPTIVLYILAGLLLGPVSGVIELSHNLELISEVGILLLLFLVGLELSFEKIRDVGTTVLWAGAVQMSCTAVPVALIAKAYGHSTLVAAFIGVAVMFSSTVAVVKQLEQAGETDETYGRLSVGVLLVQDLMVIMVLTVVSAMEGKSTVTPMEVALSLGGAALGMTLLLAVALAASRWFLPRLFDWTSTNQETAFLWSLGWCFSLVGLSKLFHLSPEMGAFLAGMAVAQLPYAHHFRRRIHPLTNFFVAIFFITLGVKMQLQEAAGFGSLAVALIGFVMLGKLVIFVVLLPRMGQTRRTSLLTGISLSQISEFSLIFGALGVEAGLVDPAVLALLSLVALVTMSLSSVLFSVRHRLVPGDGPSAYTQPERGQVLIVGVNALTEALLRQLQAEQFDVIVLDQDAGKLTDLNTRTVLGDARDERTLEEAGFRHARAVIIALHIESTSELIAHRCKAHQVPCIVHAFDTSVEPLFESLGADYLIRSRVMSTLAIQEELHRSGVLDS